MEDRETFLKSILERFNYSLFPIEQGHWQWGNSYELYRARARGTQTIGLSGGHPDLSCPGDFPDLFIQFPFHMKKDYENAVSDNLETPNLFFSDRRQPWWAPDLQKPGAPDPLVTPLGTGLFVTRNVSMDCLEGQVRIVQLILVTFYVQEYHPHLVKHFLPFLGFCICFYSKFVV